MSPYLPFAPFLATDARAEQQVSPISSLAMVINANSKLQKFIQDHGSSVTPRIQQFSELMSALVKEIFFVPKGFHSAVAPVRPLRIAQSVISPTPPQTVPAAEQSLGMTNRPEIGPAHDVMELASTLPGEDILSCAVEHPEVPDTDGLTDSEFRLVSAQARDPDLDPQQRADAAMLMIFGTHRKHIHDCLAFQSPDSSYW